jgi:ribosomal protein S18 acetylase RimI-like enzyme
MKGDLTKRSKFMIKKSFSLTKKIVLAIIILLGVGAGSYYVFVPRTYIYTFDEQRDTHFILDIFKKNWYWLVSEYSDFSPEYMLHNLKKSPEQTGNVIIKVLYKGKEPVGFVTYLKENFYRCQVLFLAVREEFRSKGYGKILLQHAVNDLRSQHCTKIWLVTRTTNHAAMKVYRDSGFVETNRDNGFVYFEYHNV